MKRVTLELGGKSPTILLDDAALDQAIPAALVMAPSRMIPSPTPTEPVKEILSTSGLRTSSAPTASPRPITTLQTPLGSLAAFRHFNHHLCLQRAELTGLDHNRQMNSAFAFQAVISPATPTGSKVTVVLPQLRVNGSSWSPLSAARKALAPDCTMGRAN